mgnify:CR=1 FL=1
MQDFVIDGRRRLQMRNAEGAVPNAKRPGEGLRRIFRPAGRLCVGRGLDVGASFFSDAEDAGLPGAVPVDRAIPGSGDAMDLSMYGEGAQDYVFHSRCLEHLPDPEKGAAECFRVPRPGGVPFLYLPFPGHHARDPEIRAGARPEHRWQPEPSSVSRLLTLGGFDFVYCGWDKDDLHSFAVVGRKPGRRPGLIG